jgi:hypothetical protein
VRRTDDASRLVDDEELALRVVVQDADGRRGHGRLVAEAWR